MQAPHEGIFLIPSLTRAPGHRHRHPGWRFFAFLDIRLGSFWSVSDFLNITIEVGRSVLVVLHLMSIFSTSVWAHSAPHNCVCRCAAPGIRHFARSLWQEISFTKSSSMVPRPHVRHRGGSRGRGQATVSCTAGSGGGSSPPCVSHEMFGGSKPPR